MTEQNEIQTPECLKGELTFEKLLGEGTSGKTYLARLNSEGHDEVAVNVMKFSLAEEFKSYELFRREAEVLKSLEIEGVPRVYACEIGDDSSISYIIQEYINYPSLSTIMKERKKLDEVLTIRILEKLSEIIFILQTNYAPPIIHRDIKPSNVLCDLSGEEIRVSLIDFGAVANPQKKSAGSTVAGTFGYMAPEQMLSDVAIQSDYYSLGALAVHLLTGVMPYEMGSLDGAFELDFLGALREHAPKTSKPMLELLSHLLAPEASKRPANAYALVEEVRCVKMGKMPISKNGNDDESHNPFVKCILFLLSKIKPKPIDIQISKKEILSWSRTQGIVRVNSFPAEYTFEANGRTWCGRDTISHTSPTCTVCYNPNNPRFNFIDNDAPERS